MNVDFCPEAAVHDAGADCLSNASRFAGFRSSLHNKILTVSDVRNETAQLLSCAASVPMTLDVHLSQAAAGSLRGLVLYRSGFLLGFWSNSVRDYVR